MVLEGTFSRMKSVHVLFLSGVIAGSWVHWPKLGRIRWRRAGWMCDGAPLRGTGPGVTDVVQGIIGLDRDGRGPGCLWRGVAGCHASLV